MGFFSASILVVSDRLSWYTEDWYTQLVRVSECTTDTLVRGSVSIGRVYLSYSRLAPVTIKKQQHCFSNNIALDLSKETILYFTCYYSIMISICITCVIYRAMCVTPTKQQHCLNKELSSEEIVVALFFRFYQTRRSLELRTQPVGIPILHKATTRIPI